MEWTKHKITRWRCGMFTITEDPGAARPYRLDGPDDQPRYFETLTEAKAQAATLNELVLSREYIAQLQAELKDLRGADAFERHATVTTVAMPKLGPTLAVTDDDDDGRGIPAAHANHA